MSPFPHAAAGIDAGKVILQVNSKPIKNAAEFRRAAKDSSDAKRMLLLIRKDEMQRCVALTW
jgi:serine protease Do